MSTPFYDLASLVVVPSGYKASKVYAQKPLTTDGQLTFSRASTATRVNSAGLIETVSSNVPRLDYTNSTCPKLLLEPQRTNYAPKSEQLTSWVTYGVGTITATANAAISPSGYQDADEFNVSRSTSANSIFNYEVTSTLPAGSMTNSVWLKAKTASDIGKKVCIWSFQGGNKGIYEATLTADWVRHSTPSWTATAAPTEVEFGLLNGYATSTLDVSFYAWGYQCENGAYATSYLPTTTAAVTRLADACSKTGISSLIGQTEGVIFIDWIYTERDLAGIIPITISNGTVSTNAYIYIDNNNKVFFDFVVSGTPTGRITTGNGYAVKGTRYKMACAYKANDFVFYINGTQIGTDNSGAIAALSQLDFGYPFASGYSLPNTINQALLFKTRLTNAQLAELTTL